MNQSYCAYHPQESHNLLQKSKKSDNKKVVPSFHQKDGNVNDENKKPVKKKAIKR